MISSLLEPQAAPDLPHVEPVVQRYAACPLCHTTSSSLSNDAFTAGDGWRCTRCGQEWNARRLATVAAYAAWRSTAALPLPGQDTNNTASSSSPAIVRK